VPGPAPGTVVGRARVFRVHIGCEQIVEEERIVSTDVGAAPAESRTTAASAPPLLHLHNISKSFGAVHALVDIDLEVPAGQVTALAGDNGAGKSVLIKCIAGIHSPDSGEILWEGRPVHLRTPRESAALGIETVHQDLALCDNLDIAQNMFLGREKTRHFVLAEDAMEQAAGETLQSLAVTTVRSVRQLVASLSGGQRQAVAIAKAVLWNSKLVIMDEPTAALGVAQTAMVLNLVRSLADRGLAVMIVSHNMNDVFEVADRVAVLRLGQLVAQRPASEMDAQIVVDLMTTGVSDRVAGAKPPPMNRTLTDPTTSPGTTTIPGTTTPGTTTTGATDDQG
jgi:ABC-type sugar transport system ATPase subunit